MYTNVFVLLLGLKKSIVCLGYDFQLHGYSPIKVQGHPGVKILECPHLLQIGGKLFVLLHRIHNCTSLRCVTFACIITGQNVTRVYRVNGRLQSLALKVAQRAITKQDYIHFMFQYDQRNHLELVSTKSEHSVIFTPG